MTFQEFEKITIEDKEETNVPELVGQDVPRAVLMNTEDYGFGVFIVDEKSLETFECHLSKVDHQLNKAVLIN